MKNINIVSEVELHYNSKVRNSNRLKITESADSVKIFRSIEKYNNNINLYECLYAMYLNRSNKVLSVMLISEGGSVSTVVDIKKILAPAILQNASGIIISHNHPSGNVKASTEDQKITTKLQLACKLIDITLLDHIIITGDEYFSFADECMIY